MDDWNNNYNRPPEGEGENQNQQPQQPQPQQPQQGAQQQSQPPYPPNYYSGQQQYAPPPPPPPQQAYQWNYDTMQQSGEKKPRKNKGLRVFGILVATIALVVVSSFAIYGIYVATTGQTLDNFLPPASSDGGSSSLPNVTITDRPGTAPTTIEDGGFSNNEIFKKVSPAVVGVVSYVNVGNGYFSNEAQAQGSGIIMSEDGYIITNEHVVSGAHRIEVVTTDGESYEATIIGSDIQTDLAVIKVEVTGLQAAEFGNSDQLEVGDRVVAIGNPGGLQFASSLTVGYVSALNRILATGEVGYALECIQTDAAINPGNSGGALINAYGQVVGINSAKIADANFEGMGFSIPINDATPIIEDIIQNGKVTGRAMLGIQAVQITATQAQMNSIPMGLMIQSFTEGSDLPGKGAKVGDIITHINSIPVYSTTGSADVLKDFKPGETVTLSLYRMDTRGRAGSFNVDVVLVSS